MKRSHRAASRAAIARVARAFGPELPRVVFVGGAVVALYDLPSHDIRETQDVDCIVELTSLPEFYAFTDKLRRLGFKDGDRIGRFELEDLRVDVMPTEAASIGFTNRWYASAVVEAISCDVGDGLEVRVISPIFFVATKLVAFRSPTREHANNYSSSHDLEDLLVVLEASERVRETVLRDATEVAKFVREELRTMTAVDAFRDALRGHFDGDEEGEAMAGELLAWLDTL